MKWHWNKDLRVAAQVTDHEAGGGSCQGRPPAVFEAESKRTRHRPVSNRRIYTGVNRRLSEAWAALGIVALIILERRMASRTPGRSKKMERPPAGCAKPMITIRDRSTSGASGRQRECDNRTKKPNQHGGACRGCMIRAQAACMSAPEIFDRAARRVLRNRAALNYSAHDFVRAAMLDGISERLATVKRSFVDVLDLGSFDGAYVPPAGSRVARMDAGHTFARQSGAIQADEDRLPFADASFDLVVSAGVLDQVNDVPGSLALARRALRPDGLFLGALLGAGSLSTLRGALRTAEGERPVARFHPQIDVRSAGDLLMRAGFALPVADTETLRVRYGGLGKLLDDLRGMAATNVLIERQPLRRDTLARTASAFADAADPDGRTAERFEIIFLTGWAPSPDQPQPARRGSATASLAAELARKS